LGIQTFDGLLSKEETTTVFTPDGVESGVFEHTLDSRFMNVGLEPSIIYNIFDGLFGPIIRTVSSIDSSIEVYRTDPGTWTSISKSTSFKYNKRPYFWYLDGYIYLPNVDWDAIRVEAVFDDDISPFQCDEDKKCMVRQDQPLPFPEYLFSEIEQMVLQEFTTTMKVPQDNLDDGQNALR